MMRDCAQLTAWQQDDSMCWLYIEGICARHLRYNTRMCKYMYMQQCRWKYLWKYSWKSI